MKKFAWILVAMLIASTAFGADVLSKNAVGFVKITIPAKQYEALSIPFNDSVDTEGIAWTNTAIAKDAVNGSTVYFWNGETQNWDFGTLTKNNTRTQWAVKVRSRKIKPGEMFLYKPATEQTVTISGEVPEEKTLDVAINAGKIYSAIGNPYPCDIEWTNTPVAEAANNGDTVYFWNVETQNWDFGTLTKNNTRTQWAVKVRSKVLEPGHGVFFKAAGSAEAKAVTFDRPYKWPKPENEAAE